MYHIHRVAAKDHNPQNNKIEGRKSLGMGLSASALLTGKAGVARQSETLASVRHPQTPLSLCIRPPEAVTGGDSLTGFVGISALSGLGTLTLLI